MIIKIFDKEYTVVEDEFALTDWLLDILVNNPPDFDELKMFEFFYFEGVINLYCSQNTKRLVIKDYVEWSMIDGTNKDKFYVNFYKLNAIKIGGCRFNIIDNLSDDDTIKLEY